MKYCVGDKVVIRQDLKAGKRYPEQAAVQDMVSFGGGCFTINRVLSNGDYTLAGDRARWSWSEDMIDHEATARLSNQGFHLNDLKTGHLIQTEDGELYAILKSEIVAGEKAIGRNLNGGYALILSDFFCNLAHRRPEKTISKVYLLPSMEYMWYEDLDPIEEELELVWSRAVDMTFEEILRQAEKAVGKKINIVPAKEEICKCRY